MLLNDNDIDVKDLLQSKKDAVLSLIRSIRFQHRNGVPAEYFSIDLVSAEEAREAYDYLKQLLPKVPHLTPEEIDELSLIIDEYIQSIPDVEKEKEEEIKRKEEKQNAEDNFMEAHNNFKKRSAIQRFFEKFSKHNTKER